MKLYHGCAAKDLPSILSNGLCPRGDKQSNWSNNPSRADMVYLTVAYPFYFALGREGLGGVVEIDSKNLDRGKFFPDEDFLTNAFAMRDGKALEPAQQEEIRGTLHCYGDHWKDSIRFQGNCCFQGSISPKHITRYCIFAPNARPELAEEMNDPCINLANYSTRGRAYRQLVAWMFGDRRLLPMVTDAREEIELLQRSTMDAEYLDNAKTLLAFWKKESRDRTGIEVWKHQG
jgi:hypothetical protein